MFLLRTRVLIVTAIISASTASLLFSPGGRAVACPFCLAPPETWSEILGRSDVILVGEVIRLNLFSQQIKVDVSAETVFRVRAVLKSPGRELRHSRSDSAAAATVGLPPAKQLRDPFCAGNCFTIQEFVTARPGDLYLLTGQSIAAVEQPAGSTFLADINGEQAGAGEQTDTGQSGIVQVAASAIGDSVTSRTSALSRPGSAIIVTPELMEWDSPAPLNPALHDYISAIPPLELPPEERLPYFIPFLESADAEIAADAWGEFARSPYEDVKLVRHFFQTDRLRRWIADTATSPERLGLYGMMLGLAGDASDAEFLHQQIGLPHSPRDFRFGTEGLMGGYLLLTGETGLQFLQETRFQKPGVSIDEIFSVIQAVQFIWSYEPDCIPREQLRRSVHVLLQNDQMREVVITDLARWRDWQTAPRLQQLFNTLSADDERSRKAVAGFMIALTRSKGPDAAPAELVALAESFLKDLGEQSPSTLQAAQREFGPAR